MKCYGSGIICTKCLRIQIVTHGPSALKWHPGLSSCSFLIRFKREKGPFLVSGANWMYITYGTCGNYRKNYGNLFAAK